MKQNSIKWYLFLILIFIGCTNKIAYTILYAPPQNKDMNITELEKSLSDEFHYDLRAIETVDKNILSAVEYYTHVSTKDNKGVILFLHGNAEDIYSVSSSSLAFVHLGYDILFLDYRSYGKSTGSPSPKGLNLDIQAAVSYLTKEYDNIYIYGRSIGGTSLLGALNKIDKSKIRAIVTEGAFLSYSQLSKEKEVSIPFTDYDKLDLYAPISSDKNTTLPLMLIHSIDDEVVPYSQGVALSNHFRNSKHLKITGKHVHYLDNIPNYEVISNFFQKNKNYQSEQVTIFDVNQTDNISIENQDINTTESNITNTIKEEDNNLSKGELNG